MDNTSKHACALIAAGEPLLRFGIRKLLETEKSLRVTGEATSMSEAACMIRDLKPDLFLLDLSICEGAATAIRHLTAIRPKTRTIAIVRSVENDETTAALASGARGVLPRGSTEEILLECVRTVLAGRRWSGEKAVPTFTESTPQFPAANGNSHSPNGYRLTRRELDVIGRIATGCSNKDVGKQFSISERTVKYHLRNIYQKLEISSRVELAIFALNHGLASN